MSLQSSLSPGGVRGAEERGGCSSSLLWKVSPWEQMAGEDSAGHRDPAAFDRGEPSGNPHHTTSQNICSMSWKEQEGSSNSPALGKGRGGAQWERLDPQHVLLSRSVCSTFRATQAGEKPNFLLPV